MKGSKKSKKSISFHYNSIFFFHESVNLKTLTPFTLFTPKRGGFIYEL